MPAWLIRFLDYLTWTEVLLGVLLAVAVSIGGVFLASLLLVRLPATYFCDSHPREYWIHRHPVIRWTGLIVKNVAGGVLVVVGVLLSLPGVPGPGFLTILIGIVLLDFPGKRRLERWVVGRPRIFQAINSLRERHGQPPLILDEPEA